MTPPTVLIVEDNPTTRKMLRVTLETERYRVIEAADGRAAVAAIERGRPDLVLQDLILPDIDGRDLVKRLRALPGGADLPILALSGFLSRLEESRATDAGFTAFLVKPVEPSRLIESIRGYLPIAEDVISRDVAGRRLLIVDDDAVQLKLARLQFLHMGYAVTTAGGAGEAMAAARRAKPDVILSDVFMPDVDGFQLCLDVRNDEVLADIPVVLMSALYGSRADRDLAVRVGANALVLRTPDFGEAAAAVLAALGTTRPTYAYAPTEHLQLAHARTVIHQLERQTAAMSGLVQRCAFQAAQLSLLSGVADALTHRGNVDSALRDVLAATLDAAGISKGALFLRGPDGALQVRQAIGFSQAEFDGLVTFFGHMDEFEAIVQSASSVTVPSNAITPSAAGAFTRATDVTSGQIVPLLASGRPVGAMIVAASRTDVTTDDSVSFARAMGNQLVQSLELSRSIDRLTASEARYRTLVEHANDAIAVLTPDGVVREMNQRWATLLGRPIESLVGCHIRDFAPPGKEDENVAAYTDAVSHDQSHVRRVDVVAANGRLHNMEVSTAALVVAGERLVITIARDVTEHRQLAEQLRQSQKLEAIGQLAGGVAHDFNNLLTAILGFCELAVGELPSAHAARSHLSELRAAGDRAADLTRQLLAFGRKQVLRPQTIDVQAQVRGLEPILRRLIRADVELAIAVRDEPLAVVIDATQIEQVLINLAVNAADAMPRGGRLGIRTDAYEVTASDRSGLPVGRYARLTVEDTGMGMSEETRLRIFEPFYTTKELGKGTGLGLATVYGIVTQSGGSIAVESAPGHGTTFTILLPAVRGDATTAAAPPAPGDNGVGGWETILLVEDDDAVRALARITLERAGYVVLSAAHPVEGEQVASAHAGPIHLLVSDVVMPNAGGPPLVERLAATHPAMRVLYMSGYADATIAAHDFLTPETPFLPKPFVPRELALKVRAVLDA